MERNECLRLLSGSTDEQKLVGLLLATKFVKGDAQAVRDVFDAVQFDFIDRLFKTGLGRFAPDKEPEQNYLLLVITVIAAFCRAPELASSPQIIQRVPFYVDALNDKQGGEVHDEATECLLAIAASSDEGLEAVCESRALHVISDVLQRGSTTEGLLKLTSFLVTKIVTGSKLARHAEACACLVPPLARQLACQQSLEKFLVLDVLRVLLIPAPTKLALGKADPWAQDVRSGLGQILHSHVGAEHRNAALELTEEMVEFIGWSWLVGKITFPDQNAVVPSNRFLFLVVESLRVEVQLILSELLAAPSTSTRYQSLAMYYALLEHIINLMCEEDTLRELDEGSLQKVFSAVDEIAGLVLELLEDAKDRGVNQGDVLLGSVRLLGRYLAETPSAHKERTYRLLGFMLSVTTEGEMSSSFAVQFMIPTLLQMTMHDDGCEALVSSGGHKQIVHYMVDAVQSQGGVLLVEALDILLNVLQKRDRLINELNHLDFAPAMPSLAAWAAKTKQNMEIAMAACYCMLVLALTDEAKLQRALDPTELTLVFSLIQQCLQHRGSAGGEEDDLIDLIVTECMECLGRYPSLKSHGENFRWR